MKPKSYTYLIILGVIIVVILLVMAILPKSSGEKQAMEDCIQSGGAFNVSTEVCSATPSTPVNPVSQTPSSTGTKPSANTSTQSSNPLADITPVMLPTYAVISTSTDIAVLAPGTNSYVASPLTVTGQARGSWFFEGVFPIYVTDSKGHIIGQAQAHAKSDWMTSDLVPFSASIAFPRQPSGSTGFLILKKDNPSGLAKNAGAVEEKVNF